MRKYEQSSKMSTPVAYGHTEIKTNTPICYDFAKGALGDVIVWANMDSATHYPTREGVHSVDPVQHGTKKVLHLHVRIAPVCKGTVRTEALESVIRPYRSKKVRARRTPCKAQTQHDQGQYLTKLTIDALRVPHVFTDLLSTRLTQDILEYERTIGDVGSEKEVEYEAQGRTPHLLQADPQGCTWK